MITLPPLTVIGAAITVSLVPEIIHSLSRVIGSVYSPAARETISPSLISVSLVATFSGVVSTTVIPSNNLLASPIRSTNLPFTYTSD